MLSGFAFALSIFACINLQRNVNDFTDTSEHLIKLYACIPFTTKVSEQWTPPGMFESLIPFETACKNSSSNTFRAYETLLNISFKLRSKLFDLGTSMVFSIVCSAYTRNVAPGNRMFKQLYTISSIAVVLKKRKQYKLFFQHLYQYCGSYFSLTLIWRTSLIEVCCNMLNSLETLFFIL